VRSRCANTRAAVSWRNLARTPRVSRPMKSDRTKPKLPRGRGGKKTDSDAANKATTAEFEREGLGVAPKE